MDTKIAMSLETEEEIQTDTESVLPFQDNISYREFKIAHLLKSKQDIPVIYRLANYNIVIQNKHQPQECM